jgi:hypothetical protein
MAEKAKPAKQVKSKAEIELDKMLAEARTAEAELAKKEASKPVEAVADTKPQAEQPKQAPEKSDALKWFFIGLVIVSLVGGYFIYAKMHQNTNPIISVTGLAVYNPESWLDGWQLVSSQANLAEIEPALKTEMMSQGVTNAANWEFSKDDDTLYFWTRIYQDNATRDKYDYVFNGPLVWREGLRANIAVGDEGIIGVYRTVGNDPLMVYVAKDKQVWYISYYNYVNENGTAYNATNMDADKQFLVDLGREFYNSFQANSSV